MAAGTATPLCGTVDMNTTPSPRGARAPFVAAILIAGALPDLPAQTCATYQRVAAGNEFSAALRTDGRVAVWGYNSFGVTSVPALPVGTAYVEVASGAADANHVIARRNDGMIVAWGNNAFGQATVSLPAGNYVQVAAGAAHNVVRRADGVVFAWGQNNAGQSTVPIGLANVVDVSAGYYHSIALRSDGSVVGWGDNSAGQLNLPALAGGLTYVDIAAGGFFTIARVSDGSLRAAGANSDGQCNVPSGTGYVQIAAGRHFALARRSDGTIVGWGNGLNGQTTPPALPPGVAYTDVAAGGYHGIATRSDGQAVAWGYNSWGQCLVPPLPLCGCQGSLVVNGGFEAGLVAGSMPPASVANWSRLTETPQVVDDDGCADPGCIQLWGNQVVGESIEQALPTPLLAGHSYKVSFCYRWNASGSPPLPGHVRVRISAGTHDGLYPPTSGLSTVCTTPNTSSTTWISFSSTWTAPIDCTALAINVENDFAVNDGAYVSWGRVDDLCIREAGHVTLTGTGCYGAVSPILAPSARPDLNSSLALETTNLQPGTPFGITILGLTPFPGGIDMAVIDMPGCRIFQSLDILTPWLTVGAMGSTPLTIPDDTSWIGLHILAQSLAITPGWNTFGGLMSNAIDLTVGW